MALRLFESPACALINGRKADAPAKWAANPPPLSVGVAADKKIADKNAVGYGGNSPLSSATSLSTLAEPSGLPATTDTPLASPADASARQNRLITQISQYIGQLLAQLSAQARSGGAEPTPGESLAPARPFPSCAAESVGGPAAAGCGGSANVRTSEKDTRVPPTEDNLHGRPPGDNRSADEIINDNPVLKNLGNQKDIKADQLKARFGDWTANNKDPKSRADAAYNMATVLNSIKALKNREGGDRGDVHTNGKIEGITKSGDARHGTEAGVLKDIAEQGLSALPQNGQLPDTKDTHVRLDGTNKDNFQWAMGRIGDFLSHIPIFKSILAPFFNNIGEARNLGEVFSGGLKGLTQGALSISRGPVGWAMTAVTDTAQIVVEEVADEKKKKSRS